ncbi:MAG: immunoglobulin domain-containing protein [Bacteroidota bacterium]|nr:immunoglobulin domain-containing protein [Bacteroidota bacterium]
MTKLASVARWVVIIVSILFLALSAYAQSWQWARGSTPNTTNDWNYVNGYRTVVDNQGNVYVAGIFWHFATIGNVTLTATGGMGDADVFVAKYNPSGVLQWVRSGGSTGLDYVYGIDVDNSGNVYISGSYEGNPCNFGNFSLSGMGGADAFIVKYDANGTVQWATRQASTGWWDYSYNLAVDRQSGDCYIVGVYDGTTTFYSNGSTVTVSLTSFGSVDNYVAKYNSNGVIQWARSIGGDGRDMWWGGGSGVAVDGSGNVYVCGVSYSATTYIGSNSTFITTSYNTPEVYLCKLNSAGTVQWARWGIGGNNAEIAAGLAVNASGSIVLVGHFSDWSGPSYGGGDVNYPLNSAGGHDVFAIRFSTSGNVVWARRTGGTGDEYAVGGGIDVDGRVYAGGYFYSSTWSHGATTFTLNSGNPDCFVVMWNSSGDPVSGLVVQGMNSDQSWHFYLHPTRKEGALAGEYYSNQLTFGTESWAPQLQNGGFSAMFVGKFKVCDYDVGLVATVSPAAPFSAGTQVVRVRMRNYGLQTVSSAQITWSVNGTPQSPVNWSGTLSHTGETIVELGSANFADGAITTISATVCCPNAQTDENSVNNSITAELMPALNGTYTIGGTNPNFPNVVAASHALRMAGVLGPVTFNIRPGTYTGHVFIESVPGSQSNRPILFQAENGDPASVIIQHNGGATPKPRLNNTGVWGGEPTIRLLNADYVTFKRLTVEATGDGGANWAVCVEMMGEDYNSGCDGVTFDSVTFVGQVPPGWGGYDYTLLLSGGNAYHSNLLVKSCTFKKGSYGVYILRWMDPYAPEHRFEDNTFTDFAQAAIYSSGTEGLVVRRNYIVSGSSVVEYGIGVDYNDGNTRIEKNRIVLTGSALGWAAGLYMGWRPSNLSGTPLVANNFIRISGGIRGGIVCSGTSNTKFFHNTVYSDGNATDAQMGVPFRSSGGSDLTLHNNIFYVANGQSAVMDIDAAAIAALDYNTVHTPGSTLGYWNWTAVPKGSAGNELVDWRTTTGRDQNSQFAPIVFANPAAGDLSLTEVDSRLYGLGSTSNGTYNMGLRDDVPDDIFGNSRYRSEVYNGAHQIIPVISFTALPPADIEVCQGESLTLAATAQVTYGAQLSYQWRRNGENLVEGENGFTGTTTNTLTVQSADPSLHAGTYELYVTATGGADAVTSPSIQVRVNVPIQIAQHPRSQTVCRGQEVRLKVEARGTVLGYLWHKDGSPLQWATNQELILTSVDHESAGLYHCVLFGTCGTEQVLTNTAVVNLAPQTEIAKHPANVAVRIGGTARLTVEAVGAEILGIGLQYQWYRGTTALLDDGRITGATTNELTIRNVRQSDLGDDYYCVVSGLCGSQQSLNGGLYLGQVEIVQGPRDMRVCSGEQVTLSVQVSSNIPNAEYSYRWFRNGQALSDGGRYRGTTTSMLEISDITVDEAGEYMVEVVANPGGAVASASAQVVVDRVPVIVEEPEDVAVCEGQVARMRVEAQGGGLRYQWYAGGAAIPGATGSSIEQVVVAAMDGMRVRCVVSNECGQVSSREAVVTVKRQPRIVEEPRGVEVSIGGTVELRVVAEGEGLRYQWKKDGQVIPGATGSVYRISNVGSSDVGRYVVEVSNECGTVVSSDVQIALSSMEENARAAGYSIAVYPQPVEEQGVVVIGGPVGSVVEVEIVDAAGRVVERLWQGELGAERVEVGLEAAGLSSGVYRCVLRSKGYQLSVPLVIVR